MPGPVVNFDVSNRNVIKNLTHFDPEKSLDFVLKGIDLLIKDLNVPLIGFSGSPFTIACYMLNKTSNKDFFGVKVFKECNKNILLNFMELLIT